MLGLSDGRRCTEAQASHHPRHSRRLGLWATMFPQRMYDGTCPAHGDGACGGVILVKAIGMFALQTLVIYLAIQGLLGMLL